MICLVQICNYSAAAQGNDDGEVGHPCIPSFHIAQLLLLAFLLSWQQSSPRRSSLAPASLHILFLSLPGQHSATAPPSFIHSNLLPVLRLHDGVIIRAQASIVRSNEQAGRRSCHVVFRPRLPASPVSWPASANVHRSQQAGSCSELGKEDQRKLVTSSGLLLSIPMRMGRRVKRKVSTSPSK